MSQDSWPFYVYNFVDDSGHIVYVGKGSKSRLKNQKKRFKQLAGFEVARFQKESDALLHERALINLHLPSLNKALMPQGDSPWNVYLTPPKSDEIPLWCQVLGTREVAKRIVLWYHGAGHNLVANHLSVKVTTNGRAQGQ